MGARWIRRSGKAPRFRYVNADGVPIRDPATRKRIDKLRVPPAWRDVRIAVNERNAIQAWGYDARGRRQYRYHPSAVARGSRRKYYRVRQLGRDLPKIRRAVERDASGAAFTKATVSALVLRLIAEGFMRVGGERYVKENKSFGITTLRKRHAWVKDGCIVLQYRGKSGIKQRQVVVAPDLAERVGRLLRTPGPRLFRYQESGRWRDLTGQDVNAYLQSVAGFPYTAKDFRTWGGTLRAATVLTELGPPESERDAKRSVTLAMRLVGAELGNTPAICRSSYVHPEVVRRYMDGTTLMPISSRKRAGTGGPAHSPEERALMAFLDEYFPDRRRGRRPE